MKNRRPNLIMSVLLVILILTSCSSQYNKQDEEYRSLYDKTMNMLDPENVHESIINNNLTSNLDQLSKLLVKIKENLPNNKMDDFTLLVEKHVMIEEIIQKGLKWDSLDPLDKLLIKRGIEILKPKQ